MTAVVWNDALRKEYQNLFDTCKIHENRVALCEAVVTKIKLHRETYRAIAQKVNPKMPWWFVGLLHHMEANCDFKKHLHNGDPLTNRTVKYPPGRPKSGNPPFSFEDSALDALRYMGYAAEQDWSMPRMLFRLEGYNGYGYRQYHPQVKSPYLWSFTHHYTKGKYIEVLNKATGKYVSQFKPELVSQQLGLAAIIKCGMNLHVFDQ